MSEKQETKLPSYGKPPVVEVAMSVQFRGLPRLNSAYLGLLWDRYRKTYPKAEHHPPIAAVNEGFESPTASTPGIIVEPTFPVPRCWFVNETGTRLIQVQQDRFILNWRKLDTEEKYPRYSEIRENFEEEWARFEEFVEAEELGSIIPNQGELTYVNHMPAGTGWDTLNDIPDVLVLCGEDKPGFLPEPEAVKYNAQYVMPNEAAQFGRLYVALDTPIHKRLGTRMVRLSLIARGPTQGEGLGGALQILDHGHEWIVNAFTAITTEEMHKIWERTQ